MRFSDRLQSKRLDPEDRLQVAEAALASVVRRRGGDSPLAAQARAEVARRLEDLGRLTEARLLRENAVATYSHVFGSDHPSTLTHKLMLVRNQHGARSFEEARLMAVDVHNVSLQVLGGDHETTKRAEDWIRRIDEA
jgi:hypothetical protein